MNKHIRPIRSELAAQKSGAGVLIVIAGILIVMTLFLYFFGDGGGGPSINSGDSDRVQDSTAVNIEFSEGRVMLNGDEMGRDSLIEALQELKGIESASIVYDEEATDQEVDAIVKTLDSIGIPFAERFSE